MSDETTPQCIWPLGAELGEGPVWNAPESALYFVDIKGRKIHRLLVQSGRRTTWPVNGQPTFVLPLRMDGFACGIDTALYRFSADVTPGFRLVLVVEPADNGNRLNDGYVDAQGHLWFGTMSDREVAPTGVLYQLTSNGQLFQRDHGYVITNGPVHGLDGRTLYHTDTLKRLVYAFDLDDEGGLHNRRTFIAPMEPGWPDGMALDAEGCLWVAFFGGWRIDRYDPQGRLVRSVRFPCANITKLAFGGDDLRTVYATTARKGLGPDGLAQQPLAGALFEFRSPVPGMPQFRAPHALFA
ncbi:MAG: SMP-30/gluconolactonase/LRE family protein [Rhodoferax sp.]